MKKLFFILFALVAGCSSGGSGETQSCFDIAYGYEYEQIDTETGLTLQPTISEVGSFATFISFEEMVEEYKDLEACAADNDTPGPNIVFTSFNHVGFRLELALYYYAQQTVYIDTDHEEWLPTRNCISDREFLRHEFMHHVLYLNGEDDSHSNPKFEQCEALGPKSCNGEYCE